jgi:hypothetical protein
MGRRPSARGFLHELGDPRLDPGGQFRHREGDRPHLAIVEHGVRLELERRIPHIELRLGLEEADHLAALGVGGHPVVRPRDEVWRALRDQRVDPDPTLWNDREGPGLYGGYLQVATDQRERRAASSRMLAMAKEARHTRPRPERFDRPRGVLNAGATNALQRRTTATIYVASAEAAEASGRMQKNSAS